jgi:hypothetical protein
MVLANHHNKRNHHFGQPNKNTTVKIQKWFESAGGELSLASSAKHKTSPTETDN